MTLTIPELAPSLNGANGLMRMHWGKRKKLLVKWQYLIMESAAGKKHKGPCSVRIVRYYAYRPLDNDNLYAAAKIPLDALRKQGIIADDDTSTMRSLQCEQVKVSKKIEQRTEITITPA